MRWRPRFEMWGEPRPWKPWAAAAGVYVWHHSQQIDAVRNSGLYMLGSIGFGLLMGVLLGNACSFYSERRRRKRELQRIEAQITSMMDQVRAEERERARWRGNS